MLLQLPDGTIDLSEGIVRRGDSATTLRSKELALLSYLAARPAEVVARAELYEQVWGYHPETRSRTLDSTVRRLRAAIEVDPKAPLRIRSEIGVGYRYQPFQQVQAAAVPPEHEGLVDGWQGAAEALDELLQLEEIEELKRQLAADWRKTIAGAGAGQRFLARVAKLHVPAPALPAFDLLRQFTRTVSLDALGEALGSLAPVVALKGAGLIRKEGRRVRLPWAIERVEMKPEGVEILRSAFRAIHPTLGPCSDGELLLIREHLADLEGLHRRGALPPELRFAAFHAFRQFPGELNPKSVLSPESDSTDAVVMAYHDDSMPPEAALEWIEGLDSRLATITRVRLLRRAGRPLEAMALQPDLTETGTDTDLRELALWAYELGGVARNTLDFEVARRWFQHASRWSHGAQSLQDEALLGLAELHWQDGAVVRAERTYRSIEVRQRLGVSAAARRQSVIKGAIVVGLSLGNLREARAGLERMQKHIAGPTASVRAAVHLLAIGWSELGELKRSEEAHFRDLDLVDDHLDSAIYKASARTSLGGFLVSCGRLVEAEAKLTQAVSMLEALNKPSTLGPALSNLAMCARLQGQFELASTLFRRGIAVLSPHDALVVSLLGFGLVEDRTEEAQVMADVSHDDSLHRMLGLVRAFRDGEPLPEPFLDPVSGVEAYQVVRSLRLALEQEARDGRR